MDLQRLLTIYNGSDGSVTTDLYRRLEKLGPHGRIGLNLFRAHKCSARAKVYRGGVPGKGSYKRMAYERKNWSLQNLVHQLEEHAASLGIAWGWREDPTAPAYRWVLYIDLPTGQVSYHAEGRGRGPEYPGDWDRVPGASLMRILHWISTFDGDRPTLDFGVDLDSNRGV